MSKAVNKTNKKANPPELDNSGIAQISVAGYKSISQETSIEIRPLTILAGANSSGKSSIMQPLLLLKQTLEAPYDPGPLKLDGPVLRFTSAEQLLSRIGKRKLNDTFSISIRDTKGATLKIVYSRANKNVEIQEMSLSGYEEKFLNLRPNLSQKEIFDILSSTEVGKHILSQMQKISSDGNLHIRPSITRNRCFLDLELTLENNAQRMKFYLLDEVSTETTKKKITNLIHLPGLRGNPERTYSITAVSQTFPGTFESYAASVIAHWQTSKNKEKLDLLGKALQILGLSWKVEAEPVDGTKVELRVGRLPLVAKGGNKDLVSIADVGFGVSQTLPVIVALLVAEPGQLVYLEQPEIHLHPRAQTALAQLLSDAAKRGVRVVVETHSSLLLLGVQSLVAEGTLPTNLVKLHWFSRNADGMTEVTSTDLDETGAFGDWPEDFAEVSLEAQDRYLTAAELQIFKKN